MTDSKVKKLSVAEGLDLKYPRITTKNLLDYRINPQDHIAGKGLLRRGAASLLIGGTGIGKSVLVMQFAVYLAAGQDIFGVIKVRRPSKVLLLNSQNDKETLKRDIASICRYTNISEGKIRKNLDIRYVPTLPPREFHPFFEYIIEKNKPDLVIIDPYQDFIGSVDINSAESFFEWRDRVDAVIKKHNCAMLTTPHTTKPQPRRDWLPEEDIYMAVGTSAISNWCRTGMVLLHNKEDLTIYELRFTKCGERAGMVKGKKFIKRLYLEHESSEDDPCWKLRDNQIGAVKINEEAIVANMAWTHPDWSCRKISDETKISKSKVSRLYPKELKKKKYEGRKKK